MKIFKLFIFALFLSILSFGCSDNNVSPNPNVDNTDAYKKIVTEIVNSESEGFSAVINDYYENNKTREEFITDFLQNIRYYADSSGYVYAYDTNYICITNPVLPSYKGTYHYDDQDSKGTYIFHEMKSVLDASGMGFVYYYFNNPTTNTDEQKTSYVKLVPDTKYWIGAGLYLERIPSLNLTLFDLNKLIIQNCVHTTATGFGTVFSTSVKSDSGRAALIRKYNDDTRFFSDRSGYFFVDGTDGISISYPTRKDLENTDLRGIKDNNGVYPVVEMISTINASGCGYVQYNLLNPASGNVELKTVYVEKITGTNFFIGAGFYSK